MLMAWCRQLLVWGGVSVLAACAATPPVVEAGDAHPATRKALAKQRVAEAKEACQEHTQRKVSGRLDPDAMRECMQAKGLGAAPAAGGGSGALSDAGDD